MYDPAILLAILLAARKTRNEILADAADTALANQGILVTFAEPTAAGEPEPRTAVRP
jgi:hypothetical protein